MAVQSALTEQVDVNRRKAERAMKPWLTDQVAGLKAIFDKKKYQAIVGAEWTPEASKKLRRLIRQDATWKAFLKQSGAFKAKYKEQLRSSLVTGAIAAHEEAEASVDAADGVELDWTLTASDLTKVGASDVGGFSKDEIASTAWAKLTTALDSALRTAALKQRNMMAVRTEFNRRADSAVQMTLSNLARSVGDATTDGFRFIWNAFANTKVKVA